MSFLENYSDYDLLNSRVLSNLDIDWTDEQWCRAPIIVPGNATKDALNIEATQPVAAATGWTMHWYYASETKRRNKPIEDEALIAKAPP